MHTSLHLAQKLLILLLAFYVSAARAEPSLSREFRIGFIIPLTGDLAHVGEDIRNGVTLAIGEQQDASLRFKTIWEDSRYEPKLATTAAHKLIERDKVDLLVSIWDTADVVAPIAEQRKVPLLAIRWNHHIAEKFSYTMTMESTYRSYINSQLRLMKKLGVKTIGLVTEESAGCLLAHDYLKSQVASYDLKVVGEEVVSPSGPDYKPHLLRLRARNPDIILTTLNPVANVLVLKNLRGIAPHQHVLGYFDITQGEDRALIEGLPFVAQFKVSSEFNRKFEAAYGHTFTARAPQAYDLITLLALFHQGKDVLLKGMDLINAFRTVRGIEGAAGMLDAHGSKTIESECVWKVVRKGKQELLPESEVTSAMLKKEPSSTQVP